MAHPDCCQGTDERAMNQVLQEDTGQTSHVAFTILPTDHPFMGVLPTQPFYGDMMGISLAISANFAVLDFQTNSYHSHGKYPLVNVYITMGNQDFNGNTHYFYGHFQ